MKPISIEVMEELCRLYYVLPMCKNNTSLEACLDRIHEIEESYDIVVLNGFILEKDEFKK